MPTNTTIPVVGFGTPATSDQYNYLTVLNTSVGLFGTGAPITGSVPATTAPNFEIQAGTTTVSPISAVFGFSLPHAFPNGLLACFVQPITGGGSQDLIVLQSGSLTTSTINGQWFRGGSALTGGPLDISYIAYGF